MRGGGAGTSPGHSPLIERQQELDVLADLLEGAEAGRAPLLVVEGPAGIGKSRLLTALRAQARERGFGEVAATGGQLEQEFPFGVVRQLFEPLIRSDGGEALLEGGASPAEAVLAPVEAAASSDAHGPLSALHGLYWLTANLVEGEPLLLVVDDVQWCDRASLRFLVFLARRLEGMRLVLAFGLRSAEPGTDPTLVADLVASDRATMLRPAHLSGEAVATLIRARLGVESAASFTIACQDATGGNPLLLDRLLGVLHEDGVTPSEANVPVVRRLGVRAVSRLVLGRVGALPPEARAVAKAVAVLGDGAPLPLVAALSEVEESRVAAATAQLARAEILAAEPPLGFVHPLVRDAVYHDHSPGERQLSHTRAARLLYQRGAAVDEIASHLLLSPPRGDPWVVDVLEQAGRSARRRGATDSAVAYLQRALGEPPGPDARARIMFELGASAAPVDGPLAARSLAEAEHLLVDPRQRAEAALARAQSLLFTRPPEEALDVARRAVEALPPDLVERRRALDAMALLAVTTFGAVDDEVPRAPSTAEPHDAGSAMLEAVVAWRDALTGATAEASADRALGALTSGRLVVGDCLFAASAVTVLVLAEREEAMTWLDAIEAEGHRRGSHFAVNAALLFRGRAELARGELDDAEASLRRAAELAVLWGGDASWEAPELAGVHLARGELDAAAARLDHAGPVSDYSEAALGARRVRAELLLAQRRHAEALAAADELAAHLRAITNPAYAPWRSLRALALDGLGRTGEGVALAREELPAAERWGSPSGVSRTLRVVGTLERDVDALTEAVRVLERSPAHLERARALHALGVTLRRVRRPGDSREPLAEALELSDQCGAARLGEQIRAELYAAGGRPRVTAMAGPASLTASERRVAELAAGRASNKAIAQELFVTVKTVEAHLSRVYRKLGITSRRDLGAALTQPGR